MLLEGYSYKDIEEKEKEKDLDEADLVIIDATKSKENLVSRIRNVKVVSQKDYKLPTPILAIVDITLSDKASLFDLGITDYVSFPIIDAEIKVRIKQMLSSLSSCHLFNNNPMGETLKADNTNIKLGSANDYLAINKQDKALAEKTMSYLKDRLSEDITLENLASEMAVNRNKLSKVFKYHTGFTIFNWQREQRMASAAKMLLSTSLNIQQISNEVGYADSNNFSTAFKRIYQISPMEYRRVQEAKKKVQLAKEQ